MQENGKHLVTFGAAVGLHVALVVTLALRTIVDARPTEEGFTELEVVVVEVFCDHGTPTLGTSTIGTSLPPASIDDGPTKLASSEVGASAPPRRGVERATPHEDVVAVDVPSVAPLVLIARSTGPASVTTSLGSLTLSAGGAVTFGGPGGGVLEELERLRRLSELRKKLAADCVTQ